MGEDYNSYWNPKINLVTVSDLWTFWIRIDMVDTDYRIFSILFDNWIALGIVQTWNQKLNYGVGLNYYLGERDIA